MDLREMDDEFFDIRTNHDIMTAPVRDYIEEWLRKYIIKIIEPDQQEIVATFMPPPSQKTSTKEAQKNK
jgi:hypothetical protein